MRTRLVTTLRSRGSSTPQCRWPRRFPLSRTPCPSASTPPGERWCARRAALTWTRIASRVCRDEGVPGAVEAIDRPGLSDALATLAAKEATVLLIPRLDRLARALTVQEAALATAWKHGATVVACD